ncbi:hypothetical protein [Pseudoflavitalea rhizosphaerae]|uniref:hypothetical protein n=1 Tax=Pseudoflavitalea rhizosphaerae TaxID=1884793 RepID=UPI000F8DF5CC|nr:hypothetical protein [Pseudoflavitalea rhizosphaerae]
MLNNKIWIIGCILLIAACKKEAALQPVNAEENLLVVKDNPSDPVDHAIYQFYQSTGIPCFYNDTISRKQVGENNGVPRYFYTKLIVNWSPALGTDTFTQFRLPLDRTSLLPMLQLVKEELLPLVPDQVPLHSILFADTIFTYPAIPAPNYPAKTELNALGGLNTLVIRIVNPDTMSAASKKVYINSILQALAFKQLYNTPSINLQAVFFSISRNAFKNEIYVSDFTFQYPDGDRKPEEFGLLFYFDIYGYIITCSEQEDLRIYLDVIFNYTPAELNSRYAAWPIVLEKINVLRTILKNAGFLLPG